MRKSLVGKIALWLVGPVFFLAGCAVGQQIGGTQKTLLHVFAYTPLEGATQNDYENFKKATAEMAGKIPGLKRVWIGKLREPIPGEGDRIRTFGVAMEFDNTQALDNYAVNPVHREWEGIYERIRVQGTTTLDILGE